MINPNKSYEKYGREQLTLEQMEAAARGALSVTAPEDVQQLVASEFRGMEV